MTKAAGSDRPGMGPLEGITVVALEHAVAAPFATRQLADLGARVIKIERPDGGDFARNYDQSTQGMSSYFVWLNRGKESVALDLKRPKDRAALDALLAGADVFVQNLGPGAAERLGLGAAALKKALPRLITCSVSGYGDAGPYSAKKAYDLLIQCEAGLVAATGTQDSPAKAGISVADIAAGMYAFSGILTALYERERTGEGSQIDVSLLDALSEWMTQPFYYSAYGHRPLERTGARHSSISPYGPYRVGGGEVVFLGVQNDREWLALCERVLGDSDLAQAERFATNPLRVTNDEELRQIIEQTLGALTANEVVALLDGSGIANARIREAGALNEHPQLKARDRWRTVSTPGGEVEAPLPPANFFGREAKMGPVPALGEHTIAVLTELGLAD